MPNLADLVKELTAEQIAALPARDIVELEMLIDAELRHAKRTRLYRLFPERGRLRRGLYAKHLEFFRAGLEHQERAFIAANRVGKSMAVCYELACHLTGWYPEWWEGRRFKRAISAWVAGEDTKSTRESLQVTLFGQPGDLGTGLVPGDLLMSTTARGGVPESIDAAMVRHISGDASRCVIKTYDQGRESFQASKVDVVVLDEEPPMEIYSEALTRTMSTVPGESAGLVLCAFTPLKGISGVVLSFLPGGRVDD